MTTNEAVNLIFEGRLSPSPSTLALLAAHARTDERLWADVVRKPFGSNDALDCLNAHRLDWQNCLGELHILGGTVPPSITWFRVADGLNLEAGKQLVTVRSKAEMAGGEVQAALGKFDEKQLAVLTKLSADLKADAKAVDDLLESPGKRKPLSLNDLGEIAKNTGSLVHFLKGPLHLREEDSQALENAASMTETLIGAAVQIATEHYFGAFIAFTGAFSLVGSKSQAPDSPEVKLLKEMKKTLDNIVDKLSKLQEQARETLLRVDRLDEHLIHIRDLVMASGAGANLNQCDLFLHTREDYTFGFRGFPSAVEAEKHCKDQSDVFSKGMGALNDKFWRAFSPGSESPFHPVFFRKDVEGKEGAGETLQTVGWLRTQVYEPLLRFLHDQFKREDIDLQSTLECFLSASDSLSGLHTKIGLARSGDLSRDLLPWKKDVALEVPLTKSLTELLEPATVDLCTSYLISFLPYWEWVKNTTTGEFFSARDWEIALDGSRRNLPRTLLLWALHLVDIGLAQQNMLSGDALLGYLAKDWKPLQDDAQLSDPLTIRPWIGGTNGVGGTRCQATAMSANPVLAQNYLLYVLKKQGVMVPTYTYAAALASSSKSFLDSLFQPTPEAPLRCEFELLPKAKQGPGASIAVPGWAVKLEVLRKDEGDKLGEPTGPTIYQNLPSLLNFHYGRLRQTEAYNLLAARRAEILDHLSGYKFSPRANHKQYYSFMMLGSHLG